MTKGKLYHEIYKLDQDALEGYAGPLQRVLDEAKKEFNLINHKYPEDQMIGYEQWFKKWLIGDEE